MRILGIDWGERKIGLALAEESIVEPLGVIRYKDLKLLEREVKRVTEVNRVEKVVVGVSEGVSGRKAKEFGERLMKVIKLPISFFNETLSTLDAQDLAREAGIPRLRRRREEDSFAAAVMLQNYLDRTLA